MFEIAYESRKLTITDSEISQTFVYHICEDQLITAPDPTVEDPILIDPATYDPQFGVFFTPNDDMAVLNYIYNNFPDTRDFYLPTGIITLVLNRLESIEKTDGGWEVTLTYALPSGLKNLENYVQFGFSTNGGEEQVQKAISVKSRATRPGVGLAPPETYGFLGVTDKTVEGINLPATQLSFNITGYFEPTIWGTSILPILTGLGRHYNNALFYGFPAGEILFEYAEGQGEAMKVVPITFYFTHSPNINGVADPPFSTPLTMLGHDYVQYLKGQQETNGTVLLLPNWREVVQVHYPGNFNLLGI